MKRILVCEICSSPIGQFDEANLTLPLHGSSFEPIAEGYPQPFDPTAPYEAFLCRMCGHIATTDPNRLRVEGGFLHLESKGREIISLFTEHSDPQYVAPEVDPTEFQYNAVIVANSKGFTITPQENIDGKVMPVLGECFISFKENGVIAVSSEATEAAPDAPRTDAPDLMEPASLVDGEGQPGAIGKPMITGDDEGADDIEDDLTHILWDNNTNLPFYIEGKEFVGSSKLVNGMLHKVRSQGNKGIVSKEI